MFVKSTSNWEFRFFLSVQRIVVWLRFYHCDSHGCENVISIHEKREQKMGEWINVVWQHTFPLAFLVRLPFIDLIYFVFVWGEHDEPNSVSATNSIRVGCFFFDPNAFIGIIEIACDRVSPRSSHKFYYIFLLLLLGEINHFPLSAWSGVKEKWLRFFFYAAAIQWTFACMWNSPSAPANWNWIRVSISFRPTIMAVVDAMQ